MKNGKLLLILALALSAIPAFAGEFAGAYLLTYPDLNLNVNFGMVRDGVFQGFDQNVPLNTWTEDYFDTMKQQIFDQIDQMDFLPEEVRDMLKAYVESIMTYVAENQGQIADLAREQLPASFDLSQLPWPFDATIWLSIEGLDVPWPGTIDRNTGNFELLTLTPTLQSTAVQGWDVSLLGLLLGGGIVNRDDGYRANGQFRGDVEMLISQDSTIVFAGIGFAGGWEGQRQ
jgi:hypothetical protein